MKRGCYAIVLAFLCLTTARAAEFPVSSWDDLARIVAKVFTKAPQEARVVRQGVTAAQREEANQLLAAGKKLAAERAATESAPLTAEESAAALARQQQRIWQYHVDQIRTAAEELQDRVPELAGEASQEFFVNAACTSALNTLGGYQPLSEAEVSSLAFSLGVNSLVRNAVMQRAISLAAEEYFLPEEPTLEEQRRARDVARACEQVLKI